jgi:hypothetical protein
LAPAQYLLAVSSERGTGSGYPTTFYPGVFSPDQAQELALQPGLETNGLDLVLRAVPLFPVSGEVERIVDGRLPQQVRISPASVNTIAEIDTTVAEVSSSGHFECGSLPQGSYIIRAAIFPEGSGSARQVRGGFAFSREGIPTVSGEPTFSGSLTVAVEDKALSTLRLTLSPTGRIEGRILFDGNTRLPPEIHSERVPLVVQSLDGEDLGTFPLSRLETDGTFRTAGLPPGLYSVSIPEATLPGWYVESARQDGHDIEAVHLDGVGSTQVVFDLTSHPAELSGVVTDRLDRQVVGAVVYAFPSQDTLRNNGLVKRVAQTITDSRGRYSIRGLPAGDYLVIARVVGSPPGWLEGSFLSSLASIASRVTVVAHVTTSRDLHVDR